ncbi:MAG: twin-arginine translocase TatA/TatE family subunit [Candidatus Eisenbacteria bacterium]
MNIGGMELFVIIAIVLLLFGPSQIPKLAKGMGQAMREFKKAQREINDEIVRDDPKDGPKPPDNKLSS